MSKKPSTPTPEDDQRQSRKEVLLARKQSQQTRQLRIGVAAVGGLLALVFIIALINEVFIAPNRAVATVNGETITLSEWQERVVYERAQRIIFLERQYEAFGGDVGIVQQIGGQAIVELVQDNEGFGQTILNQMVDELIVRQAAEVRGITVTDSDVQNRIEENFAYFDGESPTPFPDPTQTVAPTPSLTPIPTAVITEALPTATPFPSPTAGPTATPRPTATPVSVEVFQEEFDGLLQEFNNLGVSEELYRKIVRAQLYQERLADALAEEQAMPTEVDHASVFLLTFTTEEEANEYQAVIEAGDFLTTWNTVRSTPFDPESATVPPSATEILWRPQTDFEASIGETAAAEVFELPLNTTSGVLTNQINEETVRYYLLQVSGRELRPLSETAIDQEKTQILTSFIDEQLTSNLQLTEVWRGRVPTNPVLDPKFLVQPTTAPPTATIPLVATPAPLPTEDGS